MDYSLQTLLDALGDNSIDSGISIRSTIEPLGGSGAPVKPAVYEGGRYQLDQRWRPGKDEPVEVVIIDNVPSQANRMEQALRNRRQQLGLPVITIALSGVGALPPHIASELTSFDLPHRNADAYLRDAVIAESGEAFINSSVGRALFNASATEPAALLEWMPQALIFGFWQSHLGKKGVQTKFARAVTAEIVGYEPASVDTRRKGLKGDPLNLSIDDAVTFDPDDVVGWTLSEDKKSGAKKSKESLSEIGHGQVPVGDDGPLGAVSFRDIDQLITISFARLRCVEAGGEQANAAVRTVLAALAVVAQEAAFSGGFSLRSGCDLRAASRSYVWSGAAGDVELTGVGLDEAVAVFRESVQHAGRLGLPVGDAWAAEPLRLVPNDELQKVIQKTFGLG